MRKTGKASKVLERRSFYKVWVTSVSHHGKEDAYVRITQIDSSYVSLLK
jgi:hypothetical protein